MKAWEYRHYAETWVLVRLEMDATAAKGILESQGISKVRHIEVNSLWLQEQAANILVPLIKIAGAVNTNTSHQSATYHLCTRRAQQHNNALPKCQHVMKMGFSVEAMETHRIARKTTIWHVDS